MTALPAHVEASRLADLEGVIERGLSTFVEVGEALLEIRDARLYRLTHGTWEAYCEDRWQMKRAHAHRLIEASQVAVTMSPFGDIPASEAVARELVPVMRQDPVSLPVVTAAGMRDDLAEGRGDTLAAAADACRAALRERVA